MPIGHERIGPEHRRPSSDNIGFGDARTAWRPRVGTEAYCCFLGSTTQCGLTLRHKTLLRRCDTNINANTWDATFFFVFDIILFMSFPHLNLENV